MAKILFISNIAKRVGSFSVASIAAAKMCGIEYYYAANWETTPIEQRKVDEEKFGIKLVHIDLMRSPYSPKNLIAYRQLLKFVNEKKIDYIHCNTPVGGLLGRLVGKHCKVKKIIYQAHGFHFYKGASKKSWLIYYPIEKWLARYTDVLITINSEDYELAKSKFTLRNNGKVLFVPGVGIDLSQYVVSDDVRINKREELGLKDTDIVCVSAGDLVARKNYGTAIEALAMAKCDNLHYLICGVGPEENNLKKLANKKGISNRVHFLGYRTDVKELMKTSDIFLFTTLQEGLPRSMMEAMACGLPCVASRIRGNVDLIEHGKGGFLCESQNYREFSNALKKLATDPDLRNKMSCENLKVIKEYDVQKVKIEIKQIYSDILR